MKRDALGTLRARIAELEAERKKAARKWLHTDAARLMLIDDRDEWQRRAEINGERADNACHELARWKLRAEVAEAALRPFAKYINARLAIFSAMSRNAYPNLLLSHGSSATADIHREDWERARVAVEGQANAK